MLGETAELLFSRVAEELLHGDRDLLDSLTQYERNLVINWMSEAIVEGKVETTFHDVLWETDYVRKPPTIEEFIEDDYYFGRSASFLHENWKQDLKAVFAPGAPYFEWIFTGAIGVGKTTVACVGMGYKLCVLSCLRDPARYYGLLPDEKIVFGIYSSTITQASDAGFYKLRGMIDSSTYFREQCPRDNNAQVRLDFERKAGKKLQVTRGSRGGHALGLDLFSFLMDEANFMQTRENKDTGEVAGQAYDLYNATYSRLQSRFGRPGGVLPGMMFLISSRGTQTDFLEEHLKQVKAGDHAGNTYVSDYQLWDCKPAHRYTFPGFLVEVGDRTARSRVLKKGEKPRRNAKVVEVPKELAKPFQEDVDQALRDLAGVATFGQNPLIRDRESVQDAVHEAMQHPFSREALTIDIQDPTLIEDHFLAKLVTRVERSRRIPKLNPRCPRFIHIDIGLTGDALGFAMGHVAGKTRTERIDAEGMVSTVINPFIVIDMMLRVRAMPGGEVDLSKIRAWVLYLNRIYPLCKVSFDQYQSKDSIQILGKESLDAGHLSVDRDDEAYLSLRSALFDRRIAYYEYSPFIDEVLDLERDMKKRKVDHPAKATKGGKGSKDVSDAVAGVVWHCLNDDRAVHETIADVEIGPREPRRSVTDTSAPDRRSTETIGVAGTTWAELESNL